MRLMVLEPRALEPAWLALPRQQLWQELLLGLPPAHHQLRVLM
jgi:hypothetical protein